jgi:hypothetical protein
MRKNRRTTWEDVRLVMNTCSQAGQVCADEASGSKASGQKLDVIYERRGIERNITTILYSH